MEEAGYEISFKTWIAVGIFVALVSILFFFVQKNRVFLIFLVVGIAFIIFGIAKRKMSEKKHPMHKAVHQVSHNTHHNITIKQCQNCHNKVYSNYKYCPFCGHKQ